MNLVINRSQLESASRTLQNECAELRALRKEIESSFTMLKAEWDTEAGKIFFQRFEQDLLNNLERYSTVFEHMAQNLSTSLQKYEEVFRAADAVADAQY